jgi:hypothetical protein
MRGRSISLIIMFALLITADRLPAPIQEEKTPVPEQKTAKPEPGPTKHKSTEASESSSARRFDGTWKGTMTQKTTGAEYSYSATLVIRDGKSADVTTEARGTLYDPQGCAGFPQDYKQLSPFVHKVANHSDHLIADGNDVMIRWPGSARLVEWGAKKMPREFAEKNVRGSADTNPSHVRVFTLKGDELSVSGSQFVYHRVK